MSAAPAIVGEDSGSEDLSVTQNIFYIRLNLCINIDILKITVIQNTI